MAQYLNGADLTNWDGWINLPLTPVYGSATTFTYPADLTGILDGGDKIKVTNNGSTKYFYVLPPVTFSSGSSTVTITGGSDYSLVNSGSPVMASLSYSKLATPHGFPQWFNYTPSWTGFSANPSGGAGQQFCISGHTVLVSTHTGTGTSNATTFTMSLPVTASSISGIAQRGALKGVDNGTAFTTATYEILSSGTVVTFYKDYSGSGWTASGGKLANGFITYFF